MTAISTQMDQGRERDDRSMSPTDTSEVKEEKEIKKMKPKDVLPPGYTKASTVATTCVHGNITFTGFSKNFFITAYVKYKSKYLRLENDIHIL